MATPAPLFIVALAGLSLGACTPPGAIAPTLEHQRRALDRLNTAYTADLALLAAQLDSAIEVRRTLLIGRIERRLIERGYFTDDGPGTQQLASDLANPAITNELLADIRQGRLTEPQAAEILHNLARASGMTGDDGRAMRDSILSHLGAVRQFDQAATDLRAAMQARARSVALLFADLNESSDALGRYAAFSPNHAEPASLLWDRAVLAHIDDPAKRQAASELLTQLLTLTAAR